MPGTSSLSSQFSTYIEQSAPVQTETLTTDPLPTGGNLLYAQVQILAKVNGAGPNTHTVDLYKVSGGVATRLQVPPSPYNFSTSAAGASAYLLIDDAAGVSDFMAGDQLRIVTAGDATDTSQLRVVFFSEAEQGNAQSFVVTAT